MPSGWVSAKRVNAAASVCAVGRRVEPLEVDVERGLVVELVDAVARALGDEHRLADAPPAVVDADAERRVRGDRGADDRVGEHPVAVELEGRLHLAGRRRRSRRRAGPPAPSTP